MGIKRVIRSLPQTVEISLLFVPFLDFLKISVGPWNYLFPFKINRSESGISTLVAHTQILKNSIR